MSTGLLLGAGASYECGMPLVGDLTQRIRGILTADRLRQRNARSRAHGTSHPDATVEYLVDLLGRAEMNYESVIGNLDIMYRRFGGHGDGQHYYGLKLEMIQMASLILVDRHKMLTSLLPVHMRYLDGIIGLANQNKPLWIFSLNHDLFMECVAAANGIPLNSGFPGATKIPIPYRNGKSGSYVEASLLSSDELERFMPFTTIGPGINLLKPHGSLDTFLFHDGRDYLKLRPLEPSAAGVLESLRVVNEELRQSVPRADGLTVTNEIVCLDEDQNLQFLRRSILAGPFKFKIEPVDTGKHDMMSYFRGGLNYLTELVSIGYGFGDAHINWAIRLWLEFSSERRLVIVDPHRTTIPVDLLHTAPQVTLDKATAFEFLERFSPTPLTTAERLARTLLVRAQENLIAAHDRAADRSFSLVEASKSGVPAR